jgi:hypothetical protein
MARTLRYTADGLIIAKESYTTGELVDLFGVGRRTLLRWLDRGWLTCYRLPPPNGGREPPPDCPRSSATWVHFARTNHGERRVRHAQLIAFCQRHNMSHVVARFAPPPPLANSLPPVPVPAQAQAAPSATRPADAPSATRPESTQRSRLDDWLAGANGTQASSYSGSGGG